MITAFFANLFAKFGKYIISAGAFLATIGVLWFGHKSKIKAARKEGTKTGQAIEEERIRRESATKAIEIKEKAQKIKESIDQETKEISDLRKAMRAAATDSDDNN